MKVIQETKNGVQVFVPYPSKRYLEEFIHLTCAPDLLLLDVFPNVKEITESMSAFNAVRKVSGAKLFGDESILLVDVACGTNPRTAILFAHMTRWNTVAIDPVLKPKGRYDKVRGLTCHSKKMEDVEIIHNNTVVVTAVHAHVSLSNVLKQIRAPELILVVIPCCEDLSIPNVSPNLEREDYSCWSPHRTVKIWKFKGRTLKDGKHLYRKVELR